MQQSSGQASKSQCGIGLTVWVVTEEVDLGYSIVSIHSEEATARAVFDKLVREYPYPTDHPELRFSVFQQAILA